MLELVVAKGSRPTGRILVEAIRAAGGRVGEGGNGVVSYGVRLNRNNVPILNAQAGAGSKLAQIEALRAARVRVPETSALGRAPEHPEGVWLGRKLHHVGGRDITLVLQPSDFALRLASGTEFFTRYIPRQTEFRVWVYRRQHLGTYQKVLRYPARYKTVGCNYDNGFAFELVPSEAVPRQAVEMAAQAVQALNLDFGAVDILQGTDRRFYVLEVNTAPGVEGVGRQVIQALARKIVRWEQLGFPRRNGDRRE